MAWFDDLALPGSTITGWFGFVAADGPDEDEFPDVRFADGTVTLEPTAKAVRASGAWVGIEPVTARIFDGELVVSEEDPRPVRILSTDADTGVKGWGWKATFDIEGAMIRPITFRAPETGVHITGDALIPITGSPVEVLTGHTGKSAYEYAVEQGYDGTEDEFAEAQLPDEVSWGNVSEKPTAFTPAPHEHDVNDVDGLGEALDSKANTDELMTITRAAPGVFTIEGAAA